MQTVSFPERLATEHLSYTAAVTNELLTQFGLRTIMRTDDAVGYGRVGLMEAARRFRPEGGVSFATFSYSRIRGAVLDGIRRSSAATRLFVDSHEDPGDQTGEEITGSATGRCRRLSAADRASYDPSDLLDALSLRGALLPAIHALTDVERQVILLYYFEGLTFERIAERIGLTKSYVSRVHRRALPELARRLRRVGLEYGLVEDAR